MTYNVFIRQLAKYNKWQLNRIKMQKKQNKMEKNLNKIYKKQLII